MKGDERLFLINLIIMVILFITVISSIPSIGWESMKPVRIEIEGDDYAEWVYIRKEDFELIDEPKKKICIYVPRYVYTDEIKTYN